MRLSINISTRGRPQQLRETIARTLPNMERPDTRLLIAIDDDDQETIAALDTIPRDDRVIFSVKPREDTRGEKSDRLLTEAPADIYVVGHDCAPILTPGFDRIITKSAEVFPDGIGCVYGPMANSSFPTLQCITAKMVDHIGHIYSHDYAFWFIDHELDDLCRMTGRYTFAPVHVEHGPMRPGKTLRMRDLIWWCNYYDIACYRRAMLACKIIDALQQPTWQKKMLKTQYIVTEKRSLAINDSVRAQALLTEAYRGEGTQPFSMEDFQQAQAGGEAAAMQYVRSRFDNRAPPDPGYIRIFNKAQVKLLEMKKEVAAVVNQQQQQRAA